MDVTREFDAIVIGGGINGTGIACDAAGRGMNVLLCEQDDLACQTSSASSKMIHGGLRYLEHFEFRLVREALAEREVLMAKAPHLIDPLRLILPHAHTTRPAWLIRMGLFLYDHLSRRRSLPSSETFDLSGHPSGKALNGDLQTAFAYSDCLVDDSRLVIANALSARDQGATILTRHKALGAVREAGHWRVQLHDTRTGERRDVGARVLINAAGAHVDAVLGQLRQEPNRSRVRLVKGSHIVVPRLYDGAEAFLLQHPDGRVIFVIPYEGMYSLVGTTDVGIDDPAAGRSITAAETAYLCDAVNHYFRRPVAAADVVWSFAGVRPLYDDGNNDPSSVTRDYVLELDAAPGMPPLLSVFGGKITTYRRLAETAMAKLAPHVPALGGDWTATAPLAGGEAPPDTVRRELSVARPQITPEIIAGLVRRHGSRTARVLGSAQTTADLGQHFGAGLTAREVDYLIAEEWAETVDDIIWRRTKTGLHLNTDAVEALAVYMATRHCAAA